MPFYHTPIPDLIVFEPNIWEDSRGYFYESFNESLFREEGIDVHFVQDNQAFSTYGVLRGLHYQVDPWAQAKLVRVLEGEVLDIVVDLRPEKPSYGSVYGIRLSAENKKQLYVPRGFAHGYVVLSPTAVFFYKCDNFYQKQAEGGIRFDDPTLQIDWEIPVQDVILSEKDQNLPLFGAHRPFQPS